jgi:hypothetical protein
MSAITPLSEDQRKLSGNGVAVVFHVEFWRTRCVGRTGPAEGASALSSDCGKFLHFGVRATNRNVWLNTLKNSSRAGSLSLVAGIEFTIRIMA